MEPVKQDSSRTKTRFNNSQLFLETLSPWTADERWMLRRMSAGQREPTERSIVLHWPVKNSIIPRSLLWLTSFFFLQLVLPASAEQQQYHCCQLDYSCDSITALCRNTSHCHFLLSAKVCKHFGFNIDCNFMTFLPVTHLSILSRNLRLLQSTMTEKVIFWEQICSIVRLINVYDWP